MSRIPPRKVPPGPFYQNIMAYTPKKKPEAVAKIKKPAAKGKGKNKVKGFGGGRGKKVKDWMFVGLEADVSDSKGQGQSFFDTHLKNLSKSQLSRLMRKIDKIASSRLTDEEKETFQQIHQLVKNTVEPLLTASKEKIEGLSRKIEKRLESMGKIRLKQLDRLMILYKGKKMRPRDFAGLYFEDIAAEYDKCVDEGKIIPEAAEKQGIVFVRNTIVKTS